MGPRPGRIVETIEVPLPRPRCDSEIRGEPAYAELRGQLWERLRDMVTGDPASDFYSGPC